MNVFITGHLGYIGSHLVTCLKKEGHLVTGCDLNMFKQANWHPLTQVDLELKKDFRNLTIEELKGYDCLIHLAAISNDPMGALAPQLTYNINCEGSIALAKLAKEAKIPRFLFASSCSIYGKGETLDLDESASFNPLSTYATSKIDTEYKLKQMADDNFSPVFLRNATAYGDSPVFRTDLVVNNLLGCAFSKGEIRIMSDGSPWRPLIHCKDIARAFVAFLTAPKEVIHNQAVNVGGNKENYQVKDVVHLVKNCLPNSSIIFTGEVGTDPRDYRVNFNKLHQLLPNFKLEYSLTSGIDELFNTFKKKNFSLADFEADKFTRLKLLKKYIEDHPEICKIQTLIEA